MRNVKVFLATCAAAAFLFVYLFIPSHITLSSSVKIPQTGNAATRGITQIQYWDKWMPYQSIEGHSFIWKEGKLTVNTAFIASAKAIFSKEDFEAPITFSAIDAGHNTAMLVFESTIDNRYLSPITRVKNYMEARKLKPLLVNVLQKAGKFYGTSKGVYGFDIKETKVKDTTLVTTEKNFSNTPTVQQVYDMIHLLENHIKKHNGIIHGDPMVNITTLGNNSVYTQVAFPLAADMPTSNNIVIKKMVLGNILEVKVVGNNNKVEQALQATEDYMHDRMKTSPAISFVTYNSNRLLEKDSSKWISTIYYPIF